MTATHNRPTSTSMRKKVNLAGENPSAQVLATAYSELDLLEAGISLLDDALVTLIKNLEPVLSDIPSALPSEAPYDFAHNQTTALGRRIESMTNRIRSFTKELDEVINRVRIM